MVFYLFYILFIYLFIYLFLIGGDAPGKDEEEKAPHTSTPLIQTFVSFQK